ncbi:MAG: hypothetical protein JRF30_07290 [Deltaproteobacteria bacterium]|nr:hypothetical protein [Deltaproteobacteria bacterium]MBW1794538.1 hypothetical protein [Deltaproteobacteria bacterium]MBW2330718.1 hypothetical protein [Deltaproteobacteria bacterium]
MDVLKTMQGRVTGIDLICTDTVVTVDGVHLDAGSVDLTGIQIGDVVEVRYTVPVGGDGHEFITFWGNRPGMLYFHRESGRWAAYPWQYLSTLDSTDHDVMQDTG